MTLQKQTVPVTFAGGLDTDTAEQLVVPGQFLVLENIVRRRGLLLQKRNGFAYKGNSITSGGTISVGEILDTFQDDLVLSGDDHLYSYVATSDTWIDRGGVSTAVADLTSIIRSTGIQSMPDMAYNGGLIAAVWEDSGGIHASIMDAATNAILVHNTQIDASADRPKVTAIGGSFVFTYLDGTSINSRYCTVSNPTTLSAEVTVRGSVIASSPYDIVSFGGAAILAYNYNGGGAAKNIRLAYVNQVGAYDASNYPPEQGIIADLSVTPAQAALTVEQDYSNNKFVVGYYDGTTVRVVGANTQLTPAGASAVEAIADVRNMTFAILARGATTSTILYYEVGTGTPTYNQFIKSSNGTISSIGAPTYAAPGVFKRGVGLASKAFANAGIGYLTAIHESALQPTYFIFRDSGAVVARLLSAVGGRLSRDPSGVLKTGLPQVSLNAIGSFELPLQARTELATDNDGTILATQSGIQRASIDLAASATKGVTVGENYHIPGGVLQNYDGVAVTEQGFHLYPENLTNGSPTGTGGRYESGKTYSWVAVYEWVDGRGQIHRSAPSIPTTYTTAAALTSVTITVPTLRVTAKTTVKIVVYRTLGNGTIYYRSIDTDNAPGSDSVSIVDNTDGSSATSPLALSEILYTTGGILENLPPPASKVAIKHKSRLVLGGLEDGLTIGISKESRAEEGVAFNDLINIRVDAAGGRVRALGSLDDKIAIFKQNKIFTLAGDGPNEAGQGSDYGEPQPIPGVIGCDNQASVVEVPAGLMFKASQGIYLLTRSLTIEPIGGPVQQFNDLTITSAEAITEDEEVRFTTAEGTCLVYNYGYGQWSTFTNHAAASATIWQGSYLHLKSNGRVNQEDLTSYMDNGQKIKMAIETSWLSVAGIQGFQRVYRYAFLGDFVSHHLCRVKLFYDFEAFTQETVYFSTQTGLGTDTYGSGSPYGSDVVYGGTGSGVFQFRSKPRRQKCETIKFRIEDLDDILATGGGSFNLVSLALDVGIKGGINRMGGNKSVGSL